MKSLLTILLSFLSSWVFSQDYYYAVTGELMEGRMGHTATFIPSISNVSSPFGAILVAGGTDGFNVKSNAEWQGAILQMTVPRTDHSANEVFGKIFIAGGWDGFSTNWNTTEIFDPTTEEFTPGPIMSSGRTYHRSVQLNDGRILITGGYDGTNNLSSCEIYDPSTNQLVPTGSMNYGRSSHTCTVLPNGKVLVTGGFNPDFGFQMNQCELYDPQTGAWTETDALSSSRDNHAAAAFTVNFNGNNITGVMVTGGRYFNSALNYFQGITSVEFWEINSESWMSLTDLPEGQSYHQMFACDMNGSVELVIPGGMMNSGSGVADTYSPAVSGSNLIWYPIEEGIIPAQGRQKYAAVKIEGNVMDEIYMFGGLTTGGDLSEVGVFSPLLVGVEEASKTTFSLYPQPSNGLVNIQLPTNEMAFVEIFNALGQKVQEFSMVEIGQFSMVTPGQYFVRVKSEKGTQVKSFLIIE
ncbi:MAG: hypothetical protein RLZZ77_811 [Bacteroidota bacterium]